MATFTGTTTPPNPQDSFLGADDDADTFRFTPLTLEAADTVIGGSGEVVDTLQFIASGAIAPAQFTGVVGIERILHHASGNSYALTAALVGGAVGGFEARGAAGADYVDGSALTNPILAVNFFAGGGADTMIGGAGNDTFTVNVAAGVARLFSGGGGSDRVVTNAASWAATDAFQGGAGTDRVLFNAAGTVTAAQLAGLASVEEIQLGNAISFTLQLDNAAIAQAGGALTVVGGANGAQLVDGSAINTGSVTYFAATGADTFLGGAGDDRFEVTEASSTGDLGAGDDALRLLSKLAQGIVVDGGAGYDAIELFAGGLWDLTGLANFEELELLSGSTLSLPVTPGFRVMGSAGRDVITLGAPGQVVAGFGGDDIVAVTAATMLGAVLNGGSQASQDVLRLNAAGQYDFRRATITGFEKIEQVAVPGGVSTILLASNPVEVQLRHQTEITLGNQAMQSVWGSWRADTIRLGVTGQFVEAGAGNDTIVASPAMLGAGTILAGGTGVDVLRLELAAAALLANLAAGAALVGVERIEIAPAQISFGVNLTLDAAPGVEILGGTGGDTVTANGAGLHGTLGAGLDVLHMPVGNLSPGAPQMDGGTGTDLLRVFDPGGAPASFVIPARFTGFEVLELASPAATTITIEADNDWTVLAGSSATLTVQGGPGDEFFEGDGPDYFGGAGNDTFYVDSPASETGVLNGEAGDDRINYLHTGGGTLFTTMPDTWQVETVRLFGDHEFRANTLPGLRLVGNTTSNNILVLAGDGQFAQGGSGGDLLINDGGLAATLAGGEGADTYQIMTSHQALWTTPGQTILDLAVDTTLDRIRIEGSGSLVIDFNDHEVHHIDGIRIASPGAAVNLTFASWMGAEADGNNNGIKGDFLVETLVTMTVGVRLDADAFGADDALVMLGAFDGNDTIIGGGDGDTINGSGGTDSIVGDTGGDSINGGAGDDTIRAGSGGDFIIGGAGGDVINLAESIQAVDRVRFLDINDGTVDIDNSVGVAQTTADSIGGFDAAIDDVNLSRVGLGLGNGGVANVAANGAWNIGASAVFLFESDSVNSDTLNSNSFASFDAISFAVNVDNGQGFGSSAGRTVALVISNPETEAVRRTGVYVWNDVDGDSVLEASDIVRLLGVFHGVTANGLASSSAVQIFA